MWIFQLLSKRYIIKYMLQIETKLIALQTEKLNPFQNPPLKQINVSAWKIKNRQ